MNKFVIIIEFLVASAVLFGAVQMYFTINKIWKRKHLRSVAESISIYEKLLRIFIGIPFLIKFTLLDQNISPALDISIVILSSMVILLVGMGVWVQGNQKLGFWSLLIDALKLENRDATHLIRTFLQPKKPDQVLEILMKLACIDKELDDKEFQMIQAFANQWGFQTPEFNQQQMEKQANFSDLRECVTQYLKIQPPFEQAVQLLDMMELIIQADEKVTKEEDLIYKELVGLINHYIRHENHHPQQYEVLLVPQQEEQIQKIQAMFPQKELNNHRGGKAFLIGKFYSKEYANEVCQPYIQQGIVAVWCPV